GVGPARAGGVVPGWHGVPGDCHQSTRERSQAQRRNRQAAARRIQAGGESSAKCSRPRTPDNPGRPDRRGGGAGPGRDVEACLGSSEESRCLAVAGLPLLHSMSLLKNPRKLMSLPKKLLIALASFLGLTGVGRAADLQLDKRTFTDAKGKMLRY